MECWLTQQPEEDATAPAAASVLDRWLLQLMCLQLLCVCTATSSPGFNSDAGTGITVVFSTVTPESCMSTWLHCGFGGTQSCAAGSRRIAT